MGRYTLHIVGESNYQDAVRQLSPGDLVRLLPEPENPYDPRAIKVTDLTEVTFGYVERDSWLTRAMLDDKTMVSASVLEIIGGEPGKPSLGVVLEVLTARDADAATSRSKDAGFSGSAPGAVGPLADRKPLEVTINKPVKVTVKQHPGCLATGVGLFLLLAVLGTIFGGNDAGSPDAVEDMKKIDRAMAWQTTPKRDPEALVQPAPVGHPKTVAEAAIRKAGHSCAKVATALRYPSDGSISATCTGGERYLVFTAKDVGVMALNCAAAMKFAGIDCAPSTLREAVAAGLN